MNSQYTIILFYIYTDIESPALFREREYAVCSVLGITGRMIIAQEGVNATLEGETEAIEKYIKHIRSDRRFKKMDIKTSVGTGTAFPRLSVKVRKEIVASGLGSDVDPAKDTGIHLSPYDLKKMYEQGEDFEVIDMRNSYEYAVGHFKGSHDAGMEHFRDLPKVVDRFTPIKDKKIITVCTGGVRCEKASAYLKARGFTKVYQLHGGMHRYMEVFPGEDFVGALYTFDGRVTMDFGRGEQPEVVGKCIHCGSSTERYTDCREATCGAHFLACDGCRDEAGNAGCTKHHA